MESKWRILFSACGSQRNGVSEVELRGHVRFFRTPSGVRAKPKANR